MWSCHTERTQFRVQGILGCREEKGLTPHHEGRMVQPRAPASLSTWAHHPQFQLEEDGGSRGLGAIATSLWSSPSELQAPPFLHAFTPIPTPLRGAQPKKPCGPRHVVVGPCGLQSRARCVHVPGALGRQRVPRAVLS